MSSPRYFLRSYSNELLLLVDLVLKYYNRGCRAPCTWAGPVTVATRVVEKCSTMSKREALLVASRPLSWRYGIVEIRSWPA